MPNIRDVPTATVVLHPVTLTTRGRIRRADIARLAAVPAVAWRFVQRRGQQLPDLPAPGARVACDWEGSLHQGQVRRLRPPEADEDPDDEIFNEVVYEDGDVGDYTREELLPLLQRHAVSDFRHLRVADGE